MPHGGSTTKGMESSKLSQRIWGHTQLEIVVFGAPLKSPLHLTSPEPKQEDTILISKSTAIRSGVLLNSTQLFS